ncbi:MAG: hypothetical protein Q8O67_32190 [Deltaproteobacteria bacterium]|nr:hypothetical protein [Deltaproteobacteria bacterium]
MADLVRRLEITSIVGADETAAPNGRGREPSPPRSNRGLRLVVCALGLAACGQSRDLAFGPAARETLPVMDRAASSTQSLQRGLTIRSPLSLWTWGDINWEMYVLLVDLSIGREYGVENIYKVLEDADGHLSALNCGTELNRTVASPFAFGDAPQTYACGDGEADSWVAWSDSDGTMKALTSFAPTSDHLEQAVLEGFVEATGEMSLKLVSYNDYDVPGYEGSNRGKFIIRMDVSGNASEHSFTVRTIRRNPGADTGGGDGYALDMVGKGVSKGSRQTFLLKAQDNRAVSAATYFCIPADASAVQMQELVGTGDVNDPALDACAAWRADVEALPFLDATSDIPAAPISLAPPF